MGGSSNSDAMTEIRFAPYIESKHSSAINKAVETRESIIDDSPYEAYTDTVIDDAFFSFGFVISSFPTLYDTFGKFMAGVDIDELFGKTFSEKLDDATLNNLVMSETALMDDAIEQQQGLQVSSRIANAVESSTFIIGRAGVEEDRIKETTKLRLEIKYSLIPGIVKQWQATLNWDKSLVTKYAEAIKNYYLCKIGTDEANYRKKTENTLWPITVLDFERTILAAMTGARVSRVMTARERSDLSKSLLVASHTWQGAQIGSYWGPYGAIIGGVIGFAVGMAAILME